MNEASSLSESEPFFTDREYRLEPVVGWRAWNVDRLGQLYSPVVNTVVPWPAYSPKLMEDGRYAASPRLEPYGGSGLYAVRRECMSELPRVGWLSALLHQEHYFPRVSTLTLVIGTVALFGTVVEHERGWRASQAYPQTVYLPTSQLDTLGPLLTTRYGLKVLPLLEILPELYPDLARGHHPDDRVILSLSHTVLHVLLVAVILFSVCYALGYSLGLL